jgi:hypothetical protein
MGRLSGLFLIASECLIAGLGIVLAIILAAAGAMLYTAISQRQNNSIAS